MNKTLLLLLFCLVLRSTAQAQHPDISRYETAYAEIADMHDGNLDYGRSDGVWINHSKHSYYENKTITYFDCDYLQCIVIFCRFGICIPSGVTICILYE